MSLKRIDAKDINYADSAARFELKVGDTKGIGEARLYMGHNESELDEFFDFANIDCFFLLKEDLLRYLDDAQSEYLAPTREYRSDITKLYNENINNTKAIPEKTIKINFRKTYDAQKRYYIVLENGKENRANYDLLRNICLPRFTIITFVKLEDTETRMRYVYFKPIFYIDPSKKESQEQEKIENTLLTENQKQKYRRRQTQYRLKLLESMPACLITQVTDDRLLVACHIKPYSECDNETEQYDTLNGIVFTPTYHTLFDLGFISFSKESKLIVSPFLSNLNKNRLGLIDGKSYRLQNGSEKYMKYHREHILNVIKFNELDFVN